MRKIKLTPKGLEKTAIVDDEDFKVISKFKWRYHLSGGYASRNFLSEEGKQKTILMHRFIIGARPKEIVDHKNGNGLDNRKSNLRICTHAQNIQNQKLHANNTSGAKGVDWLPKKKRWRSRIQANKRGYVIGTYRTLDEAVAAYDAASRAIHGVFGRQNSNL